VRQTEKRAATYRKVLGMGASYLTEMQAMLIRMSCLEQDFVVRGRPSMAGALGGGAGGSQDASSMYMANQQDSGDMPADADDTEEAQLAMAISESTANM